MAWIALASLQFRGASAWTGSLSRRGGPLLHPVHARVRLFSATMSDAETSIERLNDETSKDFPPHGLIPGSNDGFFVVKTYPTDPKGFDVEQVRRMVDASELERLEITAHNVSVPLALMMVDPEEYPTRSRARKACRKANIMIHRGPLETDDEGEQAVFDSTKCIRARVGDRVFPGDVLAKQVRMGSGNFPVTNHKKPPFALPVVFEDDHFAIGE